MARPCGFLRHQHGSDLLRIGGIFSLGIPRNAFLKPGCHFNTFLDNDRAGQYYQLMSKTTDDILNNALRLSTTERAELAAALLASKETGFTSALVLAIDADYVLTPELVEEVKTLQPLAGVNGYHASFVYCVHEPLRGSAYPAVTVLYRRERAKYRQDGHTQRVVIDGEVRELHSPILHDDRKPLTQWLSSQDRYMRLEIGHLRECKNVELGVPDRLRKTRILFPFLIFFYCLFVKGAIRDGWAGVYYAFQRMLAEILLALYLIEEDLRAQARSDVRSQTL